MGNNNYCWHGEPVSVRFGYCIVKEDTERPLFWYNFECSESSTIQTALIPAIEVTAGDGYRFCIANHFGIGVNKLLKGGWPNSMHFSLPVDRFQEDTSLPTCNVKKFDEEEFAKHEVERRKWQKKNYPEEYEKMIQLKELAKSYGRK